MLNNGRGVGGLILRSKVKTRSQKGYDGCTYGVGRANLARVSFVFAE